jgi:hypothetical protein
MSTTCPPSVLAFKPPGPNTPSSSGAEKDVVWDEGALACPDTFTAQRCMLPTPWTPWQVTHVCPTASLVHPCATLTTPSTSDVKETTMGLSDGPKLDPMRVTLEYTTTPFTMDAPVVGSRASPTSPATTGGPYDSGTDAPGPTVAGSKPTVRAMRPSTPAPAGMVAKMRVSLQNVMFNALPPTLSVLKLHCGPNLVPDKISVSPPTVDSRSRSAPGTAQKQQHTRRHIANAITSLSPPCERTRQGKEAHEHGCANTAASLRTGGRENHRGHNNGRRCVNYGSVRVRPHVGHLPCHDGSQVVDEAPAGRGDASDARVLKQARGTRSGA